MIDDIQLQAIQYVRQETHQDYCRQRIVGLPGTLHQKLGRRSHRVMLSGYLLPNTAPDDLKKLQEKAGGGDEVTFTADITTALNVDKMVIESFWAEQAVGPAGQITFSLILAESPPLPPPAELNPFGGLGEFGLGDLGFDPGALGNVLQEIQDQAGAITAVMDKALDAVDQLSKFANLGDLVNIANPLKPITDKVGELADLGTAVKGLGDAVKFFTG